MRGDGNENDVLTQRVIGFAMDVHRQLGPGLLESADEECLCFELKQEGLLFGRQVALPLSISRFACTVDIASILSSKIESSSDSRQ